MERAIPPACAEMDRVSDGISFDGNVDMGPLIEMGLIDEWMGGGVFRTTTRKDGKGHRGGALCQMGQFRALELSTDGSADEECTRKGRR